MTSMHACSYSRQEAVHVKIQHKIFFHAYKAFLHTCVHRCGSIHTGFLLNQFSLTPNFDSMRMTKTCMNQRPKRV